MLRQIVLYLLNWLSVSLDPDLQDRIDALNEKAKAVEAEEKRLTAEIEAGKQDIAGLLITLALDAQKAKAIDEEITATRAEMERRKAELDRLPPDARVRVDL